MYKMNHSNKDPMKDMITKIQRPKAAGKSDSPKLLANIPKKEGESREDFVLRFLDKLSNLPAKPNKTDEPSI